MLIDANELPENAQIDCDICIAGSGPAGITLASELAGSSMRVCLLEGGGLPEGDPVQASTIAEQVGIPVDLVKFRRHVFGGASNLWGGVRRRQFRLRPLDPLDFEPRPWIPNSGWPVSYDQLEPFFRRACKILNLPSFGHFDVESYRDQIVPEFHNEEVQTAIFQIARPTRFGEVYANSLAASANVRVLLHARLVEIEEDPAAPIVRCFRFVTPAGRSHRISARQFVLACGGLETPRVLLASNRKAASGVGNEHDLVGRYYMQHPKGIHGIAVLRHKPLRSPLYTQRYQTDQITISGGVSFSESFQRKEEVLNHCIMFSSIFGLSESQASEAYRAFRRGWHAPNGTASRYREFFDVAASAASSLGRVLKTVRLGTVFRVANHMEQVPKPDSRLTLSGQRDCCGIPQLRTDWRIDAFEKASLCRLHDLLRSKLAGGRTGSFESDLDPGAGGWPVSQDSAHHLGTTRMHGDARQGVVDATCRVHSVRNLYISGGSVFTTSGYANPTFTIVALAVRLADHLKKLYAANGSWH